MKKYGLLFCSFLLCALFLSVPAEGAGKGKLSLSGDVDSLARGSEFEATLEMNRNPGISSLRVAVGYDSRVLEVLEVESLGLLPGYRADQQEEKVVLHWKRESAGANITSRGNLARIRFRVLKNAIYGDSTVTLTVSQSLYDARDSQGKSVPFDTSSLAFHLACPHKDPVLTVIREATFEAEGVATQTCPDCGEVKEIPLLPTLTSQDGRTVATLNAGEYRNEEEKGLRTEYLHGGEYAEAAQAIFGDEVIRVFRIHFTRSSASFTPAGDCQILLKTDFDLPEEMTLYLLSGDLTRQVDLTRRGNELSFLWQDGVFVLVSREENVERDVPERIDGEEDSPVPTATLSPQEKEKRRDILLLSAGFAVLLLCGGGVIFFARKTKHF